MNEIIKKAIIEHLFNDEMKANVIKSLNENIDVPFISEKTEAKVIDAVWDVIEEVFKKELLK